jgi:Immunoglobulin-like domain of bacterial spore germination/Sporulation and spore germination
VKRLAFAIVFLAVSCAQPDPPPTASQPPPTTSEPPPAAHRPPPAEKTREIYLDSITAANPLLVKGRARTFENSVSLRARDAKGALLVETFVTSVGEIGHHNPFEAQIWLTRDPGKTVTVEAFEYSAKDGSVRSLTSERVAFNVEPVKATLTIPDGDCTRFTSVQRTMPKTPSIARLLVEALLAEKAVPFPQGSAVRSVNLRGGTFTVDFNDRLQNVGGACAATAIRESVTRTLTQLPSVKKVVITAGGREDLALQP